MADAAPRGRPESTHRARVAVLIGSWFHVSLDCANLRANLLQALEADVHLQLTFRPDVDNCNSTSSCRITERYSQLGRIASLHLERQATTADLLAMLRASANWPRLLQWYVGAGGCKEVDGGRGEYRCSRIPENGNSFMAPVFGSARLNVLRQIYLQSRVHQRLQEYEARHSIRYETIVWSRLELQWMAPHPSLSTLPFQSCQLWTPIGEDYAGLNDRHAVFERDLAPIYLGRWDAILSGKIFDGIFSDAAGMGRQSSERYLAKMVTRYNVSHCYFPPLAYLMCCAKDAGHCYKNACVRMSALGQSAGSGGPPRLIAEGKYPKEVALALLHAAALQHPDAQLRLAPRQFQYAGAANSMIHHGPAHLLVTLPAHVFRNLSKSHDVKMASRVLGPISFNYTLLGPASPASPSSDQLSRGHHGHGTHDSVRPFNEQRHQGCTSVSTYHPSPCNVSSVRTRNLSTCFRCLASPHPACLECQKVAHSIPRARRGNMVVRQHPDPVFQLGRRWLPEPLLGLVRSCPHHWQRLAPRQRVARPGATEARARCFSNKRLVVACRALLSPHSRYVRPPPPHCRADRAARRGAPPPVSHMHQEVIVQREQGLLATGSTHRLAAAPAASLLL